MIVVAALALGVQVLADAGARVHLHRLADDEAVLVCLFIALCLFAVRLLVVVV